MSAPSARGPIAWMASNPVSANLFMFALIVAGLIGLSTVKQEIFPAFSLDTVLVQVPYPGASPDEIEQGIVLAVEEAVRGVDGVKRVRSTAAEGYGLVQVELQLGADPQAVLSDVKNEVDRIRTFPLEAEEPAITLVSTRSRVIGLVLHGEVDRRTLHQLAERSRARLLQDPALSQVEVEGLPPLQLSVEIPAQELEAHDLTLDEIAGIIAASSLELPAGSVKTEGGEVLVRLSERRRSAEELARVVLRAQPDGGRLLLGDIARIEDGFADQDIESFFDGRPAVRLTAWRVGEETPQGVAAAVHAEAARLRAELPPGIGVDIWDDDSVMLKGRIDLLLRNARMGLVLVLAVLTLFLDLRLAFWVAMGIPVSFLGAFALMPGLDVSINMISLFGFIVTLGLVVDDAIVVGENIFEKTQAGMPRLQAAVEATREMAVPVTFAVLTTVAAFAPLLFVPGAMGKIFRILPIIVILVLVFSLLESFFILPAHLGHGTARPPRGPMAWIARWQARFAVQFERFNERVYRRHLGFAVRHRHLVLAIGLSSLIATIGLLAGRIVPFSFFPMIEGDVITVAARLPYGVPVERTAQVQAVLERSARQTMQEMKAEAAITGRLARVGEMSSGGGPGGGSVQTGGHLLTYQIEFVPSAQRDFRVADFQARWQQNTPTLAGIEALSFSSDIGPAAVSAAVAVQLSHPDRAVLEAASAAMTERLRAYPSLAQVENGFASGKEQLDLALKPEARALGLSSQALARQVRAALYGAEAVREQRDRNELTVMVRLPREQRVAVQDVDELRVRNPLGGWVPLQSLAEVRRGRSPTSIEREDGHRVVEVKAALAPGVSSSQAVLESLREQDFPAMRQAFPGLRLELVGQQREQNESLVSLGRGYLFALFLIFALLAIPFKSYVQPLIVMSAIPFGLVGAVLGHLLMGFELSIISMFGIVALSGVVVNDSLVFIDTANRRQRELGETLEESLLQAGPRRLRPILLTSLTTFFGLAPMILETEVQARFLVPMAISLGFGVLFSTGVTLLLVPALAMAIEDIRRLPGRLFALLRPGG